MVMTRSYSVNMADSLNNPNNPKMGMMLILMHPSYHRRTISYDTTTVEAKQKAHKPGRSDDLMNRA